MLGIQLAAAFLSMWITNGAVTAMMLPIVLSIIQRLEHFKNCGTDGRTAASEKPTLRPICGAARRQSIEFDLNKIYPKQASFYKGLLLSVCYASSIGGIATLIGTAPNLVFARIVRSPDQKEDPVDFFHWTLFALPASILMLAFCWIWLGWLFVGFRQKEDEEEMQKSVHKMLQQKYTALGQFKHAEVVVLCCFLLQLALWITRPAIWGRWFGVHYPDPAAPSAHPQLACTRPKAEEFVHDSTVAILIAFLLFIVPRENPLRPNHVGSTVKPILTWEDVHKKFDWQTLLLMGGSFAMAKGVECSGLSALIGRSLDHPMLRHNPLLFITFACLLATVLTEFSSNTATCTILLATLKALAEQDSAIDLIRYGFPLTISCSFAFMLPAGTPPNAIIFGSGLLKVLDMVKAGILLNIFGLVVVVGLANTYGPLVFGAINLPPSSPHNSTATAVIFAVNGTF